MRSILFSLGEFHIYSFGLSMAVGLILSYFVVSRLARREGLGPDFAANILTALIVSGVIGARVAYVMEHWTAQYAANPAAIFRLRDGGLMFYGGFVLALVVALVYIRGAKLRLLPVLDILATALPLGHAFGRIGCFMNGCCHGRVLDANSGAFARAIGVVFPYKSLPYQYQVAEGFIPETAQCPLPMLPTQLMESGANFAIFAILLALAFVPKIRPGVRTGLYLMLYAVARSFIETLRSDSRMMVGPLTIAQTISISVFAAGAAVMAFALTRKHELENIK